MTRVATNPGADSSEDLSTACLPDPPRIFRHMPTGAFATPSVCLVCTERRHVMIKPMQDDLPASQITHAPLAGVIGMPIAHSRSPRLHGHWLARYGLPGHYVPIPVMPEHLAEVLRILPRAGFVGANVTIPHKEAVLTLADTVTDRAAKPGSLPSTCTSSWPAASSSARAASGSCCRTKWRGSLRRWTPNKATTKKA